MALSASMGALSCDIKHEGAGSTAQSTASPGDPWSPEGRRISEIRFESVNDASIDGKQLLSRMQLAPNSAYSGSAVDESIRELFESGLVEDVRFAAERDGDCVRVVATVLQPKLPGPVLFVGNTAFSDFRLAQFLPCSVCNPITIERLTEYAKRMEAFYRERGYSEAKVVVRSSEDGAPAVDDFVFRISEGEVRPE